MKQIYSFKKVLSAFCLAFVLVLISGKVFSQIAIVNTVNTATATTTLTGSIIVPTGVTVTVQCWGGGGGGGGTLSLVADGGDGGGGGGGAYTSGTISSAGTYSYTVGGGGAGGGSNSSGTAGTSTTINGITAGGGGGGGGTDGGNGGSGSAGTGTYNGGAGAGGSGGGFLSSSGSGGGGGGGAGSTGAGHAGSGRTGGAAGSGTGGGTGGTAPSGNGNGTSGSTIGGGGSGAYSKDGGVNLQSGGNGANGQMVLSYTMPKPTVASFSPSSYCGTSPSSALTITGTGFEDVMGNNLVTSVSVGGVTITPASDYTVSSATAITVNTFPSGSYSNTIVSVTTTAGTGNSASSMNFYTIPGNPGNPTNNAPQCSTTGVTLTASGTPTGGVTWYWQGTSSTGMSTSLGSGTTYGPVTTANTYYIRAYNGNCWSTSSGSIVLSGGQVVMPPVATTATATYACAGSSVTLGVGYTGTLSSWQGSSDNSTWTPVGSSSNPYSIPASSSYTYWRADISNSPMYRRIF